MGFVALDFISKLQIAGRYASNDNHFIALAQLFILITTAFEPWSCG
ncbi:MAG: hypothetical protein R3C60_09285 [Parvularculaceae bacterium]